MQGRKYERVRARERIRECLRLRGFDVLKDLTGRNLTIWTAGAKDVFAIHMTWISVDVYTCVCVYVCACVCVCV